MYIYIYINVYIYLYIYMYVCMYAYVRHRQHRAGIAYARLSRRSCSDGCEYIKCAYTKHLSLSMYMYTSM